MVEVKLLYIIFDLERLGTWDHIPGGEDVE